LPLASLVPSTISTLPSSLVAAQFISAPLSSTGTGITSKYTGTEALVPLIQSYSTSSITSSVASPAISLILVSGVTSVSPTLNLKRGVSSLLKFLAREIASYL
jgi:hypothetical protein